MEKFINDQFYQINKLKKKNQITLTSDFATEKIFNQTFFMKIKNGRCLSTNFNIINVRVCFVNNILSTFI